MSDQPPKVFPNRWAAEAGANSVNRPHCECFTNRTEHYLHTEAQDTTAPGWLRLNELIERAARDKEREFSPGRMMTPTEWTQIRVLPRSIATLKHVRKLVLYGSSLTRIPPEIGEMESLEEFVPYTSYMLHWFPYEITRCGKLRSSTVSTRAIYGNYKYRPPFPRLPQLHPDLVPSRCSICRVPFGSLGPRQYWISLHVASDVLPLLVHACSAECIANLPTPPEGYVSGPHQGGLELKQPDGANWISRKRN